MTAALLRDSRGLRLRYSETDRLQPASVGGLGGLALRNPPFILFKEHAQLVAEHLVYQALCPIHAARQLPARLAIGGSSRSDRRQFAPDLSLLVFRESRSSHLSGHFALFCYRHLPYFTRTWEKIGKSRDEFFVNISVAMGNTTGERLREMREAVGAKRGKKLFQREVATALEVNEDTYRSYEYDKAQLPEDLARKITAKYGSWWSRTWRWFYIGADDEVGMPQAPAAQLLVPIPFIGSIGASAPVDWTDPLESEDLEEVPPEMAEIAGRFCCRVLGDSCYDLLHPGDLAVFQSDHVERLGKMVIHRSPDKRVTVKQLKHDGERFILHPLNPSYKDEPATGRILGYLIGIVRQSGSRRLTVYDRYGISP